ncbi:MAG: hypothetical protein IV100_33550, partial [Myxococcales bacterium]|nr:hypothetical protein [Myxococcales bacterium]
YEAVRGKMEEGRGLSDAYVWLELYGNSALASLIAAGGSLTHLGPFLSISQPGFREAVLDLAADSIGDPEHYSRWSDLSLLRESEAVLRLAPLMTRAGIVSSSAALRNLFGASTRVPWRRFFGPPRSRPQLLVAPLGQSGHLSSNEGRAAGLAIMHAITNLAWQRRLVPETRRQRIFVVSDESERFIDRIVADGHEKLRSLFVHFTSSFQMLSQLEKTGDPYIATSVMANTSTKVAFATSSADADLLATEMFASQYDPLRRKHETWGTKFRPIEETRTTVARSRGSSSSWTKTDTDAVGSGHGEGRGGTTPYGAVHESSNSRNRSESYSRPTSASSGEGGSTSESVTETVSPFIAHAEFKELGAVSFHGPDDQHAEAMAAIMRQGTGECVVATLGGKPVSIRVPRMRELPVSDRELRSFLSASQALYAMPVADIQRSAQDRMDAIFREAAARRAIQRPVRGQLTDGSSVHSGAEMDRNSGRDAQPSRRPAPMPSVADADVIEDLGAPFGLGEEKPT